jgi:putative tricarboxylic transport membrane protein
MKRRCGREVVNNKKQRIIVHLFWIALAVVICWGAIRLDLGSLTDPGPGFMPFTMGALMFFLSIAGIFEKIPSAKEIPPIPRESLFKLIFTVLALWLYAFLLPVIGFIPDTLILMMFLLAVIQNVKWSTALLVSVLSVTACYLLFSSLGTEFPKGFFFS